MTRGQPIQVPDLLANDEPLRRAVTDSAFQTSSRDETGDSLTRNLSGSSKGQLPAGSWLAIAVGSLLLVGLLTALAALLATSLGWMVWRAIGLTELALAFVALAGLIFVAMQLRSAVTMSRGHLDLIARLNLIAGDSPTAAPSPSDVQIFPVIAADARLSSLVQFAKDIFQMDRAGILALRPETSELQLLSSCGDMPAHLPARFSLDDMPACQLAIETGEPILIGAAIAGSLDLPRNRGLLAFFNASSAILIPLRVGNTRIGLITLSASSVRRLGNEDRERSALFARYAGLILLRARSAARMEAAVEAQRRLVHQRDALWAVNAAAVEVSTWDAALRTIVERVPSALDVDVCVIAVVENDPEKMVIVAMTGGRERELFPAPLVVTGLYCGRSMLTRKTIAVADGKDDPCVDPLVRRMITVGSIIYLPLMKPGGAPEPTNGETATLPEVYGIMALIREVAGAFDAEQVELAEVFASRASAVIERTRLQEQTELLLEQATRDADARAVLLSELNHRVKNNLAGIVGLLTARPAGLNPDPGAKAWIDRIADRVRTMADAHDLFSGIVGDVSLPALIDRVVGGLPITEGGPIRLSVDTHAASDISFHSSKAVPLAMVLHELCYNAVVHGLRNGGDLSIVARHEGPSLEITVRDKGEPSTNESSEPRPGGGLGLTLVRGLVSRELKGTFDLAIDKAEGSVARVRLTFT